MRNPPAERVAFSTERKSFCIHPAIGVARMGNVELDPADPSTFYVGSEAPFETPNAGQDYKKDGKIKKQAQRFRIYEYENGRAVREVTLAEEDVEAIIWTVHLGNRKPALDISDTAKGTISQPTHPPVDFHPAVTRNATVAPEDRDLLCVDTGPVSVRAGDAATNLGGQVTLIPEDAPRISTNVHLATAYAEPDTGRLLVFAGAGLSEGVKDGALSKNAPFGNASGEAVFTNSDNWYDQSGDGPVTAEVLFKDGRRFVIDQAEQSAWLLCALPRYAPALNYYTDLFDVAIDAWNAGGNVPRPHFSRDIYPILYSVSNLQWVSAKGMLGHGSGRPGNYLSPERLRILGDNNPDPDSAAYKARAAVFKRIRNPYAIPPRPDKDLDEKTIMPSQMPQLPREVIGRPGSEDWDLSSVTRLQYDMLAMWREGDFEADGIYEYKPLEEFDIGEQPYVLDRGTLEGSTGTPFYPGIESWSIMANREIFAAPLRIKRDVKPGDLTMGNAIPWQADYLDCDDTWWPVQRPGDVTRNGQTLQPWVPVGWGGGSDNPDYAKMVESWWQLGFVVTTDGGATYHEAERSLGDES